MGSRLFIVGELAEVTILLPKLMSSEGVWVLTRRKTCTNRAKSIVAGLPE